VNRVYLTLISLVFTATILSPLPAFANPTFYAFDNGRIRIGTGSENSVNTNGMFQQSFY
jgi:hypothetical protein